MTCCTAETRDVELGDGEDWRSGGEMVLTGLTPDTNYSISVAAVNENGDIGLYSDPVTTTTHQCKQTSYTYCFFHRFYPAVIASEVTCSSGSAGVVVGVVVGLILGAAVGISGLMGGVFIAKRHVHR